jgi:hypothetical protein
VRQVRTRLRSAAAASAATWIGARKALTAIARELAGFIWAAGHVLQEVHSEVDNGCAGELNRARPVRRLPAAGPPDAA